MSRKRFGIDLVAGERSGPGGNCSYPELGVYRPDLRESREFGREPFTVSMTRHHVIPVQALRSFWNNAIELGQFQVLRKTIMEKIFESYERYPIVANERRTELRASMTILENLVMSERGGAIVHDRSAPAVDIGGRYNTNSMVGTFVQVYYWMPGNLFVGPNDRHRPDKADDRFEGKSMAAVGETTFTKLETAYKLMSQFNEYANTARERGGGPDLGEAGIMARSAAIQLGKVAEITGYAELKPACWRRVGGTDSDPKYELVGPRRSARPFVESPDEEE